MDHNLWSIIDDCLRLYGRQGWEDLSVCLRWSLIQSKFMLMKLIVIYDS